MPKVCIAALVAQLYYETGSEILVEDCFASRNTQITNIAHHHCQLDIIQLKNRIILQITTDHCDDLSQKDGLSRMLKTYLIVHH